MTIAHIGGVPLEETLLQLAPAGAAIATAVAVAARTTIGRLRQWATRQVEPRSD